MTVTTTDHALLDNHESPVGVVAPSSPDSGRIRPDDLQPPAGSGDPVVQQPVREASTPILVPPAAGGSNGTRPPARDAADPKLDPPGSGAFDELRIFAECFADAQDVRIRIENRLRSGTIPADVAADVLASQRHVEKLIGREMIRAFRKAAPEVQAWTKETVGLGESTMARLLGVIGHPVIARPHHWEETGQRRSDAQSRCAGSSQPDPQEEAGQSLSDAHSSGAGPSRVLVADEPYLRNVAKLWAYCGHGDPARRKRKGMDADDALALGSPQAKKLTWLLAVACIKQVGTGPDRTGCDDQLGVVRRRSPYRDVYDARRIATDDRDWTDGHKHADALRITGKTILRDLWRVARAAVETE